MESFAITLCLWPPPAWGKSYLFELCNWCYGGCDVLMVDGILTGGEWWHIFLSNLTHKGNKWEWSFLLGQYTRHGILDFIFVILCLYFLCSMANSFVIHNYHVPFVSLYFYVGTFWIYQATLVDILFAYCFTRTQCLLYLYQISYSAIAIGGC